MGFSVNEFEYTGDPDFDLSFTLGWASDTDIGCVRVGDPDINVEFDWLSTNQVRVSTADIEVGDVLRFYRTVSKSSLPVDLSQPSRLTREGINTALLHSVYMMHEVLDGRVSGAVDISDIVLDTVSEMVQRAVDTTDLMVSRRYPVVIHGTLTEEIVHVAAAQVDSKLEDVTVAVGAYPMVDTTLRVVGQGGLFLIVELFATGEYVVSTPTVEDTFSVPKGPISVQVVDGNYYDGDIAIGINGSDTDVLATTEDWPSFFEVYTGARDN